jgi:hypothetical protein
LRIFYTHTRIFSLSRCFSPTRKVEEEEEEEEEEEIKKKTLSALIGVKVQQQTASSHAPTSS